MCSGVCDEIYLDVNVYGHACDEDDIHVNVWDDVLKHVYAYVQTDVCDSGDRACGGVSDDRCFYSL